MIRRRRLYLSYAGLALVMLILGLLAYWGGLRWMHREFSRAAQELAEQQAQLAADAFAREIPITSVRKFSELRIDQQAIHAIDNLLRLNPNIVLALISDGRRVVYPAFGHNLQAQELRRTFLGDPRDIVQGVDDATLVQALRRSQTLPQGIIDVRKNLMDGAQVRGALIIFSDPAMQHDLVARATEHISRDALPLLLACIGLAGAVLWLLARQRRIAQRLRAQRDQAESLAHVGTLAAGLAHEIRNPVNALAMQLEMLEEDFDRDARAQLAPRVERIRSGLTNLERTVHEFLNYAIPDQQRPDRIDLAAELASQVRGLQSEYENAPEIQIRIPEGLAPWCDPHAFRQVVGNLLSNAVRVQRGKHAAKILIEAYREGAWVVIAVEDAGPGVATENREQIFVTFFTTEPDGTGLGLPIAKRLAQLNDGKLELAPRAASLGGARFEFRLPIETKHK